ncbi:ATP-dependent 6-phosphofructokinase [Myxococcota bacterium]|nr:ATP-dependent 6-phosphofructokinase [Myxococcota bacterium]
MNAKKLRRLGVLVGGGDAPGVNPAIRGTVYRAADAGIEMVGLWDGWAGLLDDAIEHAWTLERAEARTWYRDGGSLLGASRTNPFHCVDGDGDVRRDRSSEVLANVERLGLDGVIALGGEDTLAVAKRLHDAGLPVIGVPKTVAKDLAETDYTLGFDTAVRTAAESIERSRTPAGSHHWVQVVEVMGRFAGHLALWAGAAGGASITLIPEQPFELQRIAKLLNERLHPEHRDRRFPRYALLVAAEGARPAGGEPIATEPGLDDFGRPRLGGIAVFLADWIKRETPHDARALALGHVQRGGAPSHVDRVMGWMFGVAAVEAAITGAWGRMVAARGYVPECEIVLPSLADAVARIATLDVARFYDVERYTITSRIAPRIEPRA